MAKIVVGMSGGVDSSVSAYLLTKSGHDVTGIFMKNWEEEDGSCSATQDLQDAQNVCDKLNIPLLKINFASEYWDNVFKYFIEEHKLGNTPNPDILCNSEIKFKCFLDYAKSLGAEYIATGHYAGIEKSGNNYNLVKAKDSNKDQTYFLYLLTNEQLKNVKFPLANLNKPQIRDIAKELDLLNHDKKDSTGICFIGPKHFQEFLQSYIPKKSGNIVTEDNAIIGSHQGAMFYTIGQRQGLHIGGKKNYSEQPWYVYKKDIKQNIVYVCQGTDNPLLYKSSLNVSEIHWINNSQEIKFPLKCDAKIRYRQHEQPCLITQKDNMYYVIFYTPQRAVTPGQSVVFYQGNICSGGGIISFVNETSSNNIAQEIEQVC